MMDALAELIADRAIRHLLARYAHLADDHADDHAVDEWSQLFTPDGSLVVNARRITGREHVRQWLVSVQAGPPMRHFFTNSAITLDDATSAHGVSDLLLLARAEGRWIVGGTARYTDRFVCVEGIWLFAERTLDVREPAD